MQNRLLNKTTLVLAIFIILGLGYRYLLTQGGHYIFHMDIARDMLDVREMVFLGKLRLIGPTSGIEGLFTGPLWYYLLTIPFFLSGGNPFGSIVMMWVFWAVGGVSLLMLVKRWGIVPMVFAGVIWSFSNLLVLMTSYAFHPNLVLLLMPTFIVLIERYLLTRKTIYLAASFFVSGIFFNFEMAFGLFMPLIILVLLMMTDGLNGLISKKSWLSGLFFILPLLPQILFELKHDFFMSKSIINFITHSDSGLGFNLIDRVLGMFQLFKSLLSGLLFNQTNLATFLSVLLIPILILYFRKNNLKEWLVKISVVLVLVPGIGFIVIPLNFQLWHGVGMMVGAIILFCYLLNILVQKGSIYSVAAVIFLVLIIIQAGKQVEISRLLEPNRISPDPSVVSNQIKVIDYIYQKSDGMGFKVYTYLPSVYDYPYQYLFWWYGLKKYGYLPIEYAYSPNVPEYVKNKEKFGGGKSDIKSSNLVYLIKEYGEEEKIRGWEDKFKDLESIEKVRNGSLEIDVRRLK